MYMYMYSRYFDLNGDSASLSVGIYDNRPLGMDTCGF